MQACKTIYTKKKLKQILTLSLANCSLENAVRGRFSSALFLSLGCFGRRYRGPKIKKKQIHL